MVLVLVLVSLIATSALTSALASSATALPPASTSLRLVDYGPSVLLDNLHGHHLHTFLVHLLEIIDIRHEILHSSHCIVSHLLLLVVLLRVSVVVLVAVALLILVLLGSLLKIWLRRSRLLLLLSLGLLGRLLLLLLFGLGLALLGLVPGLLLRICRILVLSARALGSLLGRHIY